MIPLEEILSNESMPYIFGFIFLFAITFFLLNRTMFRENRNINAIISICISILAIWGLKNYTEYFDDFSYFIENLEGSLKLIFFGVGAFLVILLLYKGVQQQKEKYNFPLLLFALTGIFILLFFADRIFSIYFLPEFVYEFKWLWFVLAIAVGIFALFRGISGKESEAEKFGRGFWKGWRKRR